MLVDHQSIWRSCETEANKNAKIVAQMIVGKTGSEKIWDDSAVALIQALIVLVCRESDAFRFKSDDELEKIAEQNLKLYDKL